MSFISSPGSSLNNNNFVTFTGGAGAFGGAAATSGRPSITSRLPPVDSFIKERHLIRLKELAYQPKYPPTADENGGEELDSSELLQWNLNFRNSPPGIFLPVFVKACLEMLREDSEYIVTSSDDDDDNRKNNINRTKKRSEQFTARRRRKSLQQEHNQQYSSVFGASSLSSPFHPNSSKTESNNNSFCGDNSSSRFSSMYIHIDGHDYLERDVKISLIRWAVAVGVRSRIEQDYLASYSGGSNGGKGKKENDIADSIMREIADRSTSPAHKRQGINFEERFAHLLQPDEDETAGSMLRRRRGRISPSSTSATIKNNNNTTNQQQQHASHSILNSKPTILDLNAPMNIDFNTIISPAEIRLTTEALLGPSQVTLEKKMKAEAEEKRRLQFEAEQQRQQKQSESMRTGKLKKINIMGNQSSTFSKSADAPAYLRRKSAVSLLSPQPSVASLASFNSMSNNDNNDNDNNKHPFTSSSPVSGVRRVESGLSSPGSDHHHNVLSNSHHGREQSMITIMDSSSNGENKNENDIRNSSFCNDSFTANLLPTYWERDLRDYFLRWSDITTSVLAGAAKSAFQDLDALAATAHQSSPSNAKGNNDYKSKAFMPYASTRVVKSLRKRAAAAAKMALLGKTSALSLGKKDDDDDEDDDEDEFDDDDDDLEEMNPMSAKALKKRQKEETEMMHHGPVTCAVLAPKLHGVVTGSTDGSVKLWGRDSGDFIRNLYCCSGRTTIVGLAYVELGSAGDAVVIGTSTSHLALYSTMTNSVVKEYSGTSERSSSSSTYNNSTDSSYSSSSSPRPFAHKVPHVPLRPTETASRFRALPGTYGKRLIKPPPISSSMDSKTFFDEWRVAQDKEILQSVPGAQIQNLSRLSLLRTIYPSNYQHGIICFGTADGDVGLLDLQEDFVDAVMYGQPTDRFLASHSVVRTHSNTVTAAAYCRRHRSILSSAFDGNVMPRNADTNELLSPIGFRTKAIVSMDWCENQQMLATVTTDRKAYAWSILGKRPIHELELESRPVSVILHSGKSQMAILCDDRKMLIYDTRTFRCLQGLSVISDQAEREATIVVGGLESDDSSNNNFSSASGLNDDEVSSKASTLATVNASSNYISPYDQSATMQLAAGGQNGRKNKSKLMQYQAENNTGLLLSDKTGDIVAVHREVSVMKDSLGKVSVRVHHGKIPVYGFRFDVYDEQLEKQQKEEDHRIKQQQQLFDQSSANAAKLSSVGRRGSFAASLARLGSASGRRSNNSNNDDGNTTATGIRSRSFFGAASALRAPPVLKSAPVGILFNKHNGSIFVADSDGFLSIDIKTGEVLMCAATEKNLGQTTPSVASGGRLVAGTQAFTWTPCDSGKLRGIQHDTFLTLAKSGCIAEWNAVDGAALRVTLPQAWAGSLGKQHRRPRKDKIFTTMSMCEKLTAVAQGDLVFVLNEVARKAPKPMDLNLLNDIFLDSNNKNSNNSSSTPEHVLMQSLRTKDETEEFKEASRREELGLVVDLKKSANNNNNGQIKQRSKKNDILHSADAVADVRKWKAEKQVTDEQKETARKAEAIAKRQKVREEKESRALYGSTTQKDDTNKNKKSSDDDDDDESDNKNKNNNTSKKTSSDNDAFHNRSFEGHDAFSVDCGDVVTAMKFSAGGEYLCIGTSKGLIHTVHVETSENIYMTLSMLRAGEPTSPIVAVTWNDHVGDCTVFVGVALGRIVAIHVPTRTVMLSLHVDLGHKLSPTLLSTVAVCRHQSRSGHALEVLSYGDSMGNVTVATLQVKKHQELYFEEHPEMNPHYHQHQQQHRNQSSTKTSRVNSLRMMGNNNNNNNEETSRPSSRASSVESHVSQISAFSSMSRRSFASRNKKKELRRQQLGSRRTTSFTYQSIEKNEDGSGFHWTQPVTVQQLPEKDHTLKRLKSLKFLFTEEEEFERQVLEKQQQQKKQQQDGGEAEEEQEDVYDLDFTKFEVSDSSSSDSDDDPTVSLKKVTKNSRPNGDDDDDSFEDDENDATNNKDASSEDESNSLNNTKVYDKEEDAATTTRGPDSAHQTDASKKHEKAKHQRRAAILNEESKIKLLPSKQRKNLLQANRAVAKLRGTYTKKRRGFIFEDAYCFIDPLLLDEKNRKNTNNNTNASSTSTSASAAARTTIDYPDVDGLIISRQDRKMERPIWTGYIDGTICLSSRKQQRENHSSAGLAIGSVTQIQFLELKRVGLVHGLALFAVATADGNVSLLRWSRLADDSPASLVSLTTLKCPISSLSRGPFWHDSKVELDAKEETRRLHRLKDEETTRKLLMNVQNQQQQQQQEKDQGEGSQNIGRRKSMNLSFIGVDEQQKQQQQQQVATPSSSISSPPPNTTSSFFLTEASSSSTQPKNNATLGSFFGKDNTFDSPTSPRPPSTSPTSKNNKNPPLALGLARAFGAAGKIATKLKEKAKIAKLETQERRSKQYLPVTSAWSPMGTGVEHDESNMVYCLDDRWEQCDERDLKDRKVVRTSESKNDNNNDDLNENDDDNGVFVPPASRRSMKHTRSLQRRVSSMVLMQQQEEEEQERKRLQEEAEAREKEERDRRTAAEEQEEQQQQNTSSSSARKEGSQLKLQRSLTELFQEGDASSNASSSSSDSDSDIEANDDHSTTEQTAMPLDCTAVPSAVIMKKAQDRNREVKRRKSIKKVQKLLSKINEHPQETFAHSTQNVPLSAQASSLTTTPQVNKSTLGSPILLPTSTSPASAAVPIRRLLSPRSASTNNNIIRQSSITPSFTLSPSAPTFASSARVHHQQQRASSSSSSLIAMAKANPKLLETARQLAATKPNVSPPKMKKKLAVTARPSTTPIVSRNNNNDNNSDEKKTTNNDQNNKDNSEDDDDDEIPEYDERQQKLFNNTFSRMKQLRPNLKLQEPHPLLDAVTLKHEQIDDIKRDVNRQLEKEMVPAWLKAMRKTTQPISVQQVHIMSRPPPILLKHHQRVNAMDDPKEPLRPQE